MLEGLDEVDWQHLTHAYGSAGDVPELIRALASPDRSVGEQAVQELVGSICHQSTVYEATAFAVPFLIELLESRDVVCRDWILELLGAIARGYSVEQYERDLYEQRLVPEEVGAKWQQTNQGKDSAQAARVAVAAGFNVYLRLLDDADPLVRMAAPYPLVVSKDRSSEIVPALLRLVDKDPDPHVRASALMGLSHVAESDPAHLQRFERLLDSSEPAVVQLAAAMSLASLAGPATPRRAVDVLCESITDPEPFKPLSQWWLWDTQVGDYLQSLGPALIRYATSLLLTNLLGSPTQSPSLLWIYIMDMNFDVSRQQALTPWELTDDQRDLLARLLRIDFFWDNEDNSLRTLMSYGLPITRHELQQFLASSSPHPN